MTVRPAALPASDLRWPSPDWAAVERWAPRALLLLFVCVQLAVGWRHESWFDEAQAWLIARDASPWRILAQYARYEGSPALWHLLLWAPAHLGFPYRGLFLISGAAASIGAALVLLRAPFPLWVRAGVVFGYFFAFQYAVVARSYCLDLLLLPLLGVLHPQRSSRPFAYAGALGLLANANAHSFLLAAVIGAAWAGTVLRGGGRGEWRGMLLAAAFGGVAAATAWPPSDLSFETSDLRHALVRVLLVGEGFLDRWDLWSAESPTNGARLIGLALSALLLKPSLALFGRAGALWTFLGGVALLTAFTVLKYGQPWHMGLLFPFWVYALWIAWPTVEDLPERDGRQLSAGIAVLLAVQVYQAGAASVLEWRTVYGPGRAVAEDLTRRGERGRAPVVGAQGSLSFAVQPWAARNVLASYRHGDSDLAFYDWRAAQPFRELPSRSAWLQLLDGGRYDVLLLSSFDLTDAQLAPFQAAAAQRGWCETRYTGWLIWKTYRRDEQRTSVFAPCRKPAPTGGETRPSS